jgi:tetratricopeptide (TPR) repeat protein
LTGWWARWGTVSAPSGTGSAYREALLRRNSGAFLLERARARLSSGRYREALSLLSDLPMDDPNRLLLESGCWYYLGDLIRAESLLRRVQRLAPGRRETGVLLEKVRQRRGGVR